MLRYLYANELGNFPILRDSMFKDRADQFSRRLNWDVSVNSSGEERDEYDALNPLYIIWQKQDESHGGSMRFLPTLGPTMVNDHFSSLTDGVKIESPLIWECTRFCLAAQAERRVSAALVLGAGEVMKNFHLSHFLGIFDPRMERIYRMLGVEPDVIGRAGAGSEEIGVGLWEMQAAAWPRILRKVDVSRETSRNWFLNSIAPNRRQRDLVEIVA
ncbi:MAG: acyl-homoserine-lactone synthase [Paracoccaceae bacterium]